MGVTLGVNINFFFFFKKLKNAYLMKNNPYIQTALTKSNF